MPKSQSSSSSQGGDKIKQSSIDDLFNSTSLRKSETKRDSLTSPKSSTNAAYASSIFQKQQNNHLTSSPSTPSPSPDITNHSKVSSVVTTGSQGSTSRPVQSKYFTNSDSDSTSAAVGRNQTPRKRAWDDRSSSASIFDFFQKTLGSDSATSKESIKAKSPAVLQRTTSATTTPSSSASLQSSAGLHSVASSSSSSSSFAVMVCCPVCQAKIQESKINEHLDSCLSWIRRW